MRQPVPGDSSAALARLAAQVDRIEHDLGMLGALRADVDSHTRTLADLADLVRRLTTAATGGGAATGGAAAGATPAGGGDPAIGAAADRVAGPRSATASGSSDEPAPEWLTIADPAVAVLWLSQVDQWTRDVWTRYQPLPACWPWHPAVVAELLVCAHVWAMAATPGAGPDGLAAWHDRWRPGAAHRVARAMAACERADGDHVTAAGTRWRTDPACLDELAYWWSTTHGSTPAPGLTRQDQR